MQQDSPNMLDSHSSSTIMPLLGGGKGSRALAGARAQRGKGFELQRGDGEDRRTVWGGHGGGANVTP
jgi:hypothetical protein